ncbi:hypothetical protein Clacol_005350 [Clathrus columnatus]|uniref:Uncharacterized protein n=1 Tax=Clathrus columnatus TaxID=1419009 RepID=A0AAV5AD59_9AGAM|nr:hypothetical protein Clacol_005350 [Clathrus columnatus]
MANSDDNEDDFKYEDDYYDLRVPTASSIYPRATREETLSALLDANNSRPFHKRFPAEILLLVNNELHPPNPVHEEICSIWTFDTKYKRLEYYGEHLDNVLFDTNTKTFYMSEKPRTNERDIYGSMSAADLLYRMRCLFPNIPINSEGPNGYKTVWTAAIRHKQSGINFQVSEDKGGAIVVATWGQMLYDCSDDPEYDYGIVTPPIPQSKEEAENAFTTDALRLLNTLFGTIDGKRFIYYHPGADADYPTDDERFLAVPSLSLMKRVREENITPYVHWYPVRISPTDLSSFKSLLPDLKYDIESRKVDSVNGTASLTAILSSSQLFYRLLCHYVWPYNNADDTPPITSVWQVKLGYFPRDDSFYYSYKRTIGPSIIFMDDRGLFDIRAEGGISETMMNHLVDLVNILFSDECCHPYDGVVAGCVA